jgi:transcriptional regulator with XRE-family HTH domain
VVRATEQDAALAQRIGARIREARHRAGLTQQQLAGDRYTKAYVSALETGIARPSMVALRFLSERLGLPASHFIDEQHPAWTRLEVDLQLAAGDWQSASDGYRQLLEDATEDGARADLLRGVAEAEARLGRGRVADIAASEAARLYEDLARPDDAALARYWLAYGLYLSDAEAEARTMLEALLERVRSGLLVEPDFEMRLLMALAAVETRAGEPERALRYLEEARGFANDLDDRRRATYLFNLAITYRETGDVEAAIRTGTQALGLFRAAGTELESASIENDLALAYLAAGSIEQARTHAAAAHAQVTGSGDERVMAAVLETEAQIALAAGDRAAARRLAAEAMDVARTSGNRLAELAALLTEARIMRDDGDLAAAESRFARAADVAREAQLSGRVRDVLREWAGLRAEQGDHRGAYELTNQALTLA